MPAGTAFIRQQMPDISLRIRASGARERHARRQRDESETDDRCALHSFAPHCLQNRASASFDGLARRADGSPAEVALTAAAGPLRASRRGRRLGHVLDLLHEHDRPARAGAPPISREVGLAHLAHRVIELEFLDRPERRAPSRARARSRVRRSAGGARSPRRREARQAPRWNARPTRPAAMTAPLSSSSATGWVSRRHHDRRDRADHRQQQVEVPGRE